MNPPLPLPSQLVVMARLNESSSGCFIHPQTEKMLALKSDFLLQASWLTNDHFTDVFEAKSFIVNTAGPCS